MVNVIKELSIEIILPITDIDTEGQFKWLDGKGEYMLINNIVEIFV